MAGPPTGRDKTIFQLINYRAFFKGETFKKVKKYNYFFTFNNYCWIFRPKSLLLNKIFDYRQAKVKKKNNQKLIFRLFFTFFFTLITVRAIKKGGVLHSLPLLQPAPPLCFHTHMRNPRFGPGVVLTPGE